MAISDIEYAQGCAESCSRGEEISGITARLIVNANPVVHYARGPLHFLSLKLLPSRTPTALELGTASSAFVTSFLSIYCQFFCRVTLDAAFVRLLRERSRSRPSLIRHKDWQRCLGVKHDEELN